MKEINLKTLLDLANDEMWVRLDNEDIPALWVADYIGGYEPVTGKLSPYLDRTVEEYWLETFEDPERGDEAPVLVIKLSV